MTIKHIRWVACIGLLAIICLQYVWLVNTYKLTKESIQFRSNEVFRDATMREVFYRMEVYQDSLQKKYKDKDTSIMVRINLDEDYDFFEDGRGDKNVNQWLMSNMQVSMWWCLAHIWQYLIAVANQHGGSASIQSKNYRVFLRRI